MTTADTVAAAKLDMGQVFSDTFKAIGRSWKTILLFALISVVPGLASNALAYRAPGGMTGFVLTPLYWVFLVVGLVLGSFVYVGQLNAAVGALQGRTPSFADAARVALRRALPFLLMLLVLMIGVMVGWLLLIVPGLILMVMWSVALPAMAVEPIGPLDALGRSRALTRGNRWRIFGVYIVLLVMLVIFEMIVMVALRPIMLGGAAGLPTLIGTVLVAAVVGVGFAIFGLCFVSAIYVQLRRIKDGVGGASLAEVFD